MLSPEHDSWCPRKDRSLTETLRAIPGCLATENQLRQQRLDRTRMGRGGSPVIGCHDATWDHGAFSPWLSVSGEQRHPNAAAAAAVQKVRNAKRTIPPSNGYSRRKDIDVGVDISDPVELHIERYRSNYTYRDVNPEAKAAVVACETAPRCIGHTSGQYYQCEDACDGFRFPSQTLFAADPAPPTQHHPQHRRQQYLSILNHEANGRQTTPPKPATQILDDTVNCVYQHQCQRFQADPLPAQTLPVVNSNEKTNRLPSGNRRRFPDCKGQRMTSGFVLKGRLQVVDFNHGLKNKPELLVIFKYINVMQFLVVLHKNIIILIKIYRVLYIHYYSS